MTNKSTDVNDIPPLTREQKLKVFEEVLYSLQNDKEILDDQSINKRNVSAFLEEDSSQDEPDRKKKRMVSQDSNTSIEENSSRIMEMGHIYFFYRPRIGLDHTVNSIDDVQRFFFILKPMESYNAKNKLFIVGRKMLPPVDRQRSGTRSNAFWICLDMVSEDLSRITRELSAQTYDTITKGERTVEEARAIGEGLYAFVHNKDGSTALAYVLELPQDLSDVQRSFNIEKEAVYILSVKNPDPEAHKQQQIQKQHSGTYSTGRSNAPRSTVQPSSDRKVQLPPELQKMFERKNTNIPRRFIPLTSMQFLEHEGLEMLLVGTSNDLTRDLGTVGQLVEEEAEKEIQEGEFDSPESLFEELRLKKQNHPAAPLQQGRWQ